MTRTRNPKMKCGIVALAQWMAVLTVLVACAPQGRQVDVPIDPRRLRLLYLTLSAFLERKVIQVKSPS